MYAKVFAQIYDGSLCTHGPWEALVTFQQMLVLADQEGVVDMTSEAISRRTTIPLEIIERGIESLLQPDPKSRTPDEDGRRIKPLSANRDWGWMVVNYRKYRQLKREEDRREYHREYWHKRKDRTQHETQQTQQTQPNQPIAYAEAYAEAKAKKEKKTKTTSPAAPSDVSEEVWNDFTRTRKSPMTKIALAGIRREAGKAGMTLEDALILCCERGWRGFKAEWVSKEVRKKDVTETARKMLFGEARNEPK